MTHDSAYENKDGQAVEEADGRRWVDFAVGAVARKPLGRLYQRLPEAEE